MIAKTLQNIIPSQFALENKILPLEIENESIKVGMVDSNNFHLIKDIMLITRKNVVPVQQSEEEILTGISKLYDIPLNLHNEREQVKEFKTVQKSLVQYNGKEELKDDQSVIQNVNKIITEAINSGASDIHFEPFEKTFKVRFRKDGKLIEHQKLSIDKKYAYISRLKIMSELDIGEKRRPQDGRIRMMGGNKTVDIRVSIMPTDFGEKIVLRLLDKSSFKLDLDNIGFTKRMKEQFEQALQSAHGIVLVTGPTGSGKTTTLYTALNYLNKPDVNILTIEDPIEYNLEGINQTHVRADIGFTFAKALRSFLRQDPDIIMLGEIRDAETAEIAIRSALTGHLVLSTLHTNDAPTAITRLIEMGIEPFLVASSLRMVMAQRLVRKICDKCKKEIVPEKRILQVLNINENIKFYKGNGCDYCNHTGYAGRTVIIEMLPISESIAELIQNNANSLKIRKHSQAEGMLILREHAKLVAENAVTSLDEVLKETLL